MTNRSTTAASLTYLVLLLLTNPSLASPIAASGTQSITDHGDSFLTIALDVGYQTLSLIPDSGSFDLYIVNGDGCRLDMCRAAYRPQFSHTHRETETESRREVWFGSGGCSVELGYDEVRVHDEACGREALLEVEQKSQHKGRTSLRAVRPHHLGIGGFLDSLFTPNAPGGRIKRFSHGFRVWTGNSHRSFFQSPTCPNLVHAVKSRRLVPIWQIDGMDNDMMSVWGDGRGFQGIVGLGFKGKDKGSAIGLLQPGRKRQQQLEEEAEESTQESSEGSTEESSEGSAQESSEESASGSASASDSDSDSASEYPEARPHEASRVLFGDQFALCLPRGDVANVVSFLQTEIPPAPAYSVGRLWWGQLPQIPWHLTLPVVGERHWTVSVESGTIGSHEFCSSPCAALVDSGTSLIALSDKKIDDILRNTAVGDLAEDCSNIGSMPDLVLHFEGDRKLTISPESYVMRVSSSLLSTLENGRVELGKGKVVVLKKGASSLVEETSTSVCTYAFMETPIQKATVQGEEHEVMILGIPIFREFTVKFDRQKEEIAFSHHTRGENCDSLSRATEVVNSDAKRGSFIDASGANRHIRTLPALNSLVFPKIN